LGQPQVRRPVDDDGVGVRDVQSALDDRGAEQQVGLAVGEFEHHPLQLLRWHLAVADGDARLRDQPAQPLRHCADRLHAVVDEVHLTVALELAEHCITDQPVVLLGDEGLDRQAFFRRRIDHAHVAHAGE